MKTCSTCCFKRKLDTSVLSFIRNNNILEGRCKESLLLARDQDPYGALENETTPSCIKKEWTILQCNVMYGEALIWSHKNLSPSWLSFHIRESQVSHEIFASSYQTQRADVIFSKIFHWECNSQETHHSTSRSTYEKHHKTCYSNTRSPKLLIYW